MLHKLPNFYRVEHHGQQTAGTEYKIYSALSRKFQENFAICQKSLKHTDPKQTTGQPAYQTDRYVGLPALTPSSFFSSSNDKVAAMASLYIPRARSRSLI